MEPGAHLHRTGVGIHAFDVDGAVCLAAAYHEPDGDGYRYRYAVLCGGEAAKRALRTAVLDPGDCDEPGPGRRIAPATYADYDDFVYRLPKFIADVTRRLEERIQQTERAETQIRTAPPTTVGCQASGTHTAFVTMSDVAVGDGRYADPRIDCPDDAPAGDLRTAVALRGPRPVHDVRRSRGYPWGTTGGDG